MESNRKLLFIALALIVGGVCAFFLYFFVAGRDPDETTFTALDWVIGGMLIGPGFCYLVRWRALRDRGNT